jgi:protein phosphatase
MKELRELKKKSIVKRLTIPENKRLIFVSDIHGDLETFKKGLEKIKFSDDDYLFIIGDIHEKGDASYNLKTLRYVIELSKLPNVYPMSGNCDEVFRFILPEDAKDNFLYYANIKKHSIINDIAEEQNYKLSMDMDVSDFVNMVQEKYSMFYDFMDSLADVIIINDKIVLVHGGIDDINNIPTYSIDMLKYDRFYELSKPQEKLMIVGHYPTRNYRGDISCVNPIFDFKKKIISIDGGNHIVKGGQINFVFIESLETMKFGYIWVDHYPKEEIKQDVDYDDPQVLVNITFGDNEVEIIDQDLDFYLVNHIKTKTKMWVHTSFVYQDPKTKKYYAYDASNNFLSVKKGDIVSVVKKANPYSVIKKNGYIGLIDTKYLDEN